MAFNRDKLSLISGAGTTSVYAYATDDGSLAVKEVGYFNGAAHIFTPTTIVLAQTQYGSLFLYVQSVTDGIVTMSGANRPTLEGDLASNNTITTAEINAILASYNITTPLTSDAAVYFRDPTDVQDKTFLCKYDAGEDSWYFEKLNPCPLTANDINATQLDSLQTLVSGNKIKQSEIETALTDSGYKLPDPLDQTDYTIYINDISSSNQYLCRYDYVQNAWYQEKLTKATN